MKLKSLRTKYGFTQEFLADRLGVTAETIARWESETSPIPVKHARDLAILLGSSVGELTGKPAARQAARKKSHPCEDPAPYGTVALTFAAGSQAPRGPADEDGEYTKGATHYYPITHGERSRILSQLREYDASSPNWLAFRALNNRYVFVNPAALDSIQMLSDDVVEMPDYEHEETYRAVSAVLRGAAGTATEKSDGESAPYSRRLLEKCDELIARWGGEEAVDSWMNDLVVERLGGERLSLPAEDPVYHGIDLIAEAAENHRFIDLYSEDYYRSTFFRLAALRLVEAPVLRHEEAFLDEYGDGDEEAASLVSAEGVCERN